MIKYKQGDLLDVEEGAIIHGCNAQGVMGSGVALAIKTKYPKAYDAYKKFEEKHGLYLASISIRGIHNTSRETPQTFWVCNLITQEYYGKDYHTQYVSYGAIHLGFEKLHKHFPLDVPFHFPRIGAGRGNGAWDKISELIEFACPDRDLTCWQN